MKIKCGICGRHGLFGGAVLHPRTRRPTTRCSRCRDDEAVSRKNAKSEVLYTCPNHVDLEVEQ